MKNLSVRQYLLLGVTVIACLATGGAVAVGAVDLSASPEVAAAAEGKGRVLKEQDKMPLNYVNQPPMIPHSVDGYQVSKNTNRCLSCHGIEHYRTTGAPRISPTHFMDSNGRVMSQVAPRRYFCLQCHVPQTDAQPIIDNGFQPSPGFGQ